MHYLYLALAIISEVAGTSALKASAEFTKLVPSVIVVVGYGSAFYFMTLALRGIPLVYLVTHTITFRATQFVCSKAEFAGNVVYLSKNCNAAAGELGDSLRASRQGPAAALHFLDIGRNAASPLCLQKRALLLALGDSLNVTV